MNTATSDYHTEWCATEFGYTTCNCKRKPMSAPTPAVIDEQALQKRLEGLTANDFEIARHLAIALPKLQGLIDGTKQITEQHADSASSALTEAARIRTMIWDRDTVDVQKAFELHRSLTAKRSNRIAFFDAVIKAAKAVIGRRDREQERLAEQKRREAAEAARIAAEAQRKAEADALAAQAAQTNDPELLQQAIEVEQAPIIPVVVPEIVAPKTEGASVSYKLVGTVEEPAKYLCFLLGIEYTDRMAERANLLNEAIASWSQSGINAQLKRGLKLQDHGVNVERQETVRRTGR